MFRTFRDGQNYYMTLNDLKQPFYLATTKCVANTLFSLHMAEPFVFFYSQCTFISGTMKYCCNCEYLNT